MKNSKWLALLLVLVLVSALMPSALAADYVEPFTDVPVKQYYADPVSWAVEKEITNGMTDTTFAPDATCTRAQIVTFLYRAAGKPAVTGVTNPFTDTKAGDWYEDAMLWAVKNEITNGMTDTTFAPNAVCNRAQIVTFLHRAAGKPAVTGVANPFTDTKAGDWYEDAMLWAVKNEITNGKTDTTFGPTDPCTRGQAVTFLYRYYHLAEPGYVLMNIPYADFYAAEGTSDVDAVTSATLNKTRAANLAGGSYHKDPKGTDISGVVYPVYVADMKLLDGLKEVKDTDSVTITVSLRGQTSETTFNGKDALFENEDYAYYKLAEAPNAYKTLTKGADGKLVFSAVNVEAKKVAMTTELTYGGHHTDVTYKVTCDAIPQSGITVSGVVITADGTQYALRHVYEIWRNTELGWNWDQLDGSGLSGKTITNITYYITNAKGEYEVLTCDVSDTLKLKPAEITASFVDASTIALAGVPADTQNFKVSVRDQVGRGQTATVFAENVEVKDGKVILTTPAVEGKNYIISFTSDNYADSSVTIPFGTGE